MARRCLSATTFFLPSGIGLIRASECIMYLRLVLRTFGALPKGMVEWQGHESIAFHGSLPRHIRPQLLHVHLSLCPSTPPPHTRYRPLSPALEIWHTGEVSPPSTETLPFPRRNLSQLVATRRNPSQKVSRDPVVLLVSYTASSTPPTRPFDRCACWGRSRSLSRSVAKRRRNGNAQLEPSCRTRDWE